MAKYDFLQVDAFTTQALQGNACAIVLDADDLDTETMQAIALEMNLSETAFVMKSNIADVKARYFTPAEEVPLAGHPTIATTWALIETGFLNTNESLSYSLELRDGPINVDVEVHGGDVTAIVMSQRKPQFLKIYDPAQVLSTFGLDPSDVRSDAPIQTVSTGTPQLMVPVVSHEALRKAVVDTSEYLRQRAKGDFFSSHLYVMEGVVEGDTFARHFGTPPDLFEDPFTGSASGGMAAHAWHHGLLSDPSFTAEQGHWMGRPGRAQVEVIGPRADIEFVKVGGLAVTVMRGTLQI